MSYIFTTGDHDKREKSVDKVGVEFYYHFRGSLEMQAALCLFDFQGDEHHLSST